jgi:hypothetical protein
MLKSLTFNEFLVLLDTVTNFNFEPFGEYYPTNSTDVYKSALVNSTNSIKLHYGESELFFCYDDEKDIVLEVVGIYYMIKDRFAIVKYENDYKWKTLYSTTTFDYEPLQNAMLDETQTVTVDMTNTIGGKTDTLTLTDTLGIQTEHYSDTEKASAFDTETFRNTDNKISEVTKDETVNESINENAQGAQENTDSGTTVTTNTRRGSIGVITNQDMVEKERKVAMLNFSNIIGYDLIRSIAITGVY